MGSDEPQIQLPQEKLLRGSRGSSTVTLIALQYVATWSTSGFTVIVSENVFPMHR